MSKYIDVTDLDYLRSKTEDILYYCRMMPSCTICRYKDKVTNKCDLRTIIERIGEIEKKTIVES